jgi:hypothetical protein
MQKPEFDYSPVYVEKVALREDCFLLLLLFPVSFFVSQPRAHVVSHSIDAV